MAQPLVTRPPYGQGNPAMPVGQSQLPSGGPSNKGLPVDPGIPNQQTYAKPVEDIREEKKEDAPQERVDEADDLTKDRDRIDTREDNANKHDSVGIFGEGHWDATSKPSYPYRDGLPHAHSAATVLGLWLLRTAHEYLMPLEFATRTAATLANVLKGIDSKILDRATKCNVTLKRADINNLRWIFSVDSGNGPKLVRLRAVRATSKVTSFGKLQVSFSCSCPAWRWLGPEHNAVQGDYLNGKPVGTASPPNIKDPERIHNVCKHVAAVANLVRSWQVPSARAKVKP